MSTRPTKVDLRSRLALRIPEAAASLGLSEGCFRQALPEIEKLHVGAAVLIPVASIEKWLKEKARAEQMADDQVVSEMLNEVR